MDFSGHPVHFLVIGGAGGGLEPKEEQSDYPQMDQLIKKHHYGILEIDSSRMHFKAYDLEGNSMDELITGKRVLSNPVFTKIKETKKGLPIGKPLMFGSF